MKFPGRIRRTSCNDEDSTILISKAKDRFQFTATECGEVKYDPSKKCTFYKFFGRCSLVRCDDEDDDRRKKCPLKLHSWPTLFDKSVI